MPLGAVGLVLVSCVLHAFWNLLLKQARDKLAFTALFLMVAPILYLPMFFVLIREATFPAWGWLCVLSTGIVYFGYFIGLALAYDRGELSVAYPLSRGIGPALTLVWGVLLLGERPTGMGLAGVALIVCGVFMLHWRRGVAWSPRATWRALTSPSSLAALFVGFTYSLYSLIDKVGVGQLRIHPSLYIYLTYTTSALMVVPWVIWRQGAATLRAEWQVNRLPCVTVGALNLFAYMLVLFAMRLPDAPVSYIVPLRTVSVLFGVLLGIEVLREGERWSKVGAATLMMVGIGLMTWKG